MADKKWKFRIHDSSTTAIEHEITSSNLASAPTVGGQNILPLEGRTETRPSQIQVLDDNNFFTAKLADSGGRMVLLRRLADVQVSVDGGAFNTLFTGRIADIQDRVSFYDVTLHDERILERTSRIFTQMGKVLGSGSTAHYIGTRLLPPGLDGPYGAFDSRPILRAVAAAATDGNLVRVELDIYTIDGSRDSIQPHSRVLTPGVLSFIQADVKPDARVDSAATSGSGGNFNTLRCQVNGIDREVAAIDHTGGITLPENVLSELDTFVRSEDREGVAVWVIWSTGQTSDSTSALLMASSHEPTQDVPLHVGGIDGIRPFQLVKDAYNEIGARFSTALDDLIGDPFFGTARFIVTGPQNAARWLEEHIYQPYGVVPLIDSDGKISPTKMHLPFSSEVSDDITTLPEFTSTETAAQPQWQHPSRELVTVIKGTFTEEILAITETARNVIASDFPPDHIKSVEHTVERLHDRSTDLGRHELDVQFDGLHRPRSVPSEAAPIFLGVERFIDSLSREVFERFGDGPIRGTFTPVSSDTNVAAGDFIRLTIPTFPNPETSQRGDTRIVQALSVLETPRGPVYDWLDAGPALQPLVVPAFTLASATSDPKHTLLLTVDTLSTKASWQGQTAISSTEPASTSDIWTWTANSTSTGINSLRPFPSGNTVFFRGRATQEGRVRSNWSTSLNVATSSLATPSAIATSSITGQRAKLSWTNGETVYPTEVLLDQATTCATATLEVIATLSEGSNIFQLNGLTLDSTHCAGVRHKDGFGGRGGINSVAFETATSALTAPATFGLIRLVGEDCT